MSFKKLFFLDDGCSIEHEASPANLDVTKHDAVYCRNLRTAMIEREDFASGTSSKSTKLVHGGVRYLEKVSYQGARELL